MPTTTRQVIKAELNFLSSCMKEKPYTRSDSYDTNIDNEAHNVPIVNMRSLTERELEDLIIDRSGFEWVHHETAMLEEDFECEEKVKKEYYEEVDQLLKTKLGAKRTFIFDHTIRRAGGKNKNDPAGPDNRVPALIAHADQTPKSAALRVSLHLGEDAERLSIGRVQLVNVWRPLRGPVKDFPLAVADWRSVGPDVDLQPADTIYPDRVGETYIVRYNAEHRWYYIADQQPSDVLLLKCYESEADPDIAQLTPHTAFANPSALDDESVLPRHSIEVRVLVFYDE